MSLFIRFTEQSRNVLTLSQEEALRLNHHVLGPDHLLMGLAIESARNTCVVLNDFVVDAAANSIRGRVAARTKQTSVPGDVMLSPRTK